MHELDIHQADAADNRDSAEGATGMWRLYLRMDGRKTGQISKDMYGWASPLGCRGRLLCQLTAGATEAINVRTNKAACRKGGRIERYRKSRLTEQLKEWLTESEVKEKKLLRITSNSV